MLFSVSSFFALYAYAHTLTHTHINTSQLTPALSYSLINSNDARITPFLLIVTKYPMRVKRKFVS